MKPSTEFRFHLSRPEVESFTIERSSESYAMAQQHAAAMRLLGFANVRVFGCGYWENPRQQLHHGLCKTWDLPIIRRLAGGRFLVRCAPWDRSANPRPLAVRPEAPSPAFRYPFHYFNVTGDMPRKETR